MTDVSTMSYDQLRALVALAFDGWDGEGEVVFTGLSAEAGAELERRSDEAEAAFEAMVARHGGKAAFEYEVRDPTDGMVGHAFDLICDQFFHMDHACGGDYVAAEGRAMACLAGMARV